MSVATPHRSTSLFEPIDGAAVISRVWTLDDAYAYCGRLTRSHYENFPVASLLIPKAVRRHVYPIYAFARIADDFADEAYEHPYTQSERLEALERWLDMLIDSSSGKANHPVFIALADTRLQFALPSALFEDLLSAFSQDVTTRRYPTFDRLLDYCRRSANPIGRLILLLFGYRDEQLHRWSDAICTALQLTNHWQDIEVDLRKDRIYLPREVLDRFGVSEQDLRAERVSEQFRSLLQFEIERVRELYDLGKPLCTAVSGRLAVELRATWLGGRRILDRIEQNGYDVFRRRPQITMSDKLSILRTAIMKEAFLKR